MNKKSRFRAIFFDAGGTLFTPHPSVGEIYANIARPYGCILNPQEVEERFKQEWLRRDHLPHSDVHPEEKVWWYELVRDVFSNYDPIREFDSFFNELYDVFARPEYWKLFPEVESVIQKLKEREFILGIVSNWDARLIPLCEGLSIRKSFDFILASGIVGSSKPHSGIFEEALRLSKVKPTEAIHIGDSLKDDVKGSQKLGIEAVLVDRSGQKRHPVHTVKTLSEILPFIMSS